MLLKLLKKLVMNCLILSVLSGCTKNIAGDFCLIYEPVFADYENDTVETIKQIDKNNVIYDELCTFKPPALQE